MRALRLVVVICAAVAPLGFAPGLACAPDSFDGIVGAARDAAEAEAPTELRSDENLPAPRPIAPLSVSWVNASRVRFRWELVQGTTGARIELCRTRDCEGEKKELDAEGAELLTPEDIGTGFWFWRLYGKTAGTIGTQPSVWWEFLVRGGTLENGNGTGSIADVNGDGAPDLLVTLEARDLGPDGGTQTYTGLVPLLGVRGDPTRFLPSDTPAFFKLPTKATRGTTIAVTDLDGDGFSDTTWADEDGSRVGLFTYFGSTDGARPEAGPASTPPLAEPPNLREAGDVDGDGWGDFVVSTRRDIFVVRGTASGPGPVMYLFQLGLVDIDGGIPDLTAPMAVGAGHDRDGDGLPELAFAWPLPESPVGYLLPGAPPGLTFDFLPVGPEKRGAWTLADGDFDGRGLTDMAFATTIDGNPAICIVPAAVLPGQPFSTCWQPPAPAPPGFASSMTAGDLDEDGRDELVVGSTANGIWVLRLADGAITAEHLDVPYGAHVTTIHPGRPGPAVWAATQASGADVAIFRGTSPSATILPPFSATSFGPTIR